MSKPSSDSPAIRYAWLWAADPHVHAAAAVRELPGQAGNINISNRDL